jgi:hypothetical protein
MRNWIILLVIVFFILGCTTPEQKIIETKVETIRETYGIPDTATIKQVWPEVAATTFNLQNVIDNLLSPSQIYAADQPIKTKDEYFIDGIMYKDNSFPVSEGGDGIIHELDLTSIVQNKASTVYFLVEWESGCQDETFSVFFKPHGYNVIYEQATCRYGNPSKMAYTMTSDDCIVDWYHNYTWNFDHSGVNKQIGVIVYAVYYSNGVVLPKN